MRVAYERLFVPHSYGAWGYGIVAGCIATEFVSELKVELDGGVFTVRHITTRQEWEVHRRDDARTYAAFASTVRRHLRRQIMGEIEKQLFGE